MNTPATVPIFDPQGVLRDVPYEQMADAVKNGGMPGVRFQAPDKSIRFVPANRTQEASAAGGKLLPLEQQDVKHPGFWSTLYDDAKGLLHPSGVSPYPGMDQDTKAAMAGESFAQDQARKQAGYPVPYRAIAPVAQSVGVNVPGMEQSAKEGDVAGVAGHAVAPVATLAAAELVAHAGPAAVEALKSRAGAARPAASTVLRAASDVVSPDVTGVISPRAAHLQRLAGRRPSPDLPAAFQPLPARPPAVPGTVDAPFQAPPRMEPPASAEVPTPEPMAKTASGQNIPRALSGEEALTKALDAQGNANLLKIARSRGINVTKEAQLKPGVGDKLLIAKIYDDFSPEEIEELRQTFIETQATRAHMEAATPGIWNKVGPEANKTLSLQTYFPDVKIPAATLRRTQSAIAAAKAIPEGANAPDLLNLLNDSLKQAQLQKASQ